MYIYNTKDHANHKFNHILDPDYVYNTYTEKDLLYDYFKTLNKPSDVYTITGIYITYELQNFSFENNPQLYDKLSQHLEKEIVTHLDIGHANLFNNHTNHFFITMFDIDENIIVLSTLQFINNFKQKSLQLHQKKCSFIFKIGLYFSHPYINPYDFYNSCKNQYENTLTDHHSLLSIKPLPSSY